MRSIATTQPEVALSIVVPLYNEEQNVQPLFERLEACLTLLHLSYEIVCIDDGSRDQTLPWLIEHHRRNPAIKVISFSRNFGKEAALTAGIHHATGRAVIPFDADLQDPPELIAALVEKWKDGYDVVDAVRQSRSGESWMKRFTSHGFYWLIGRVTNVPIPAATGDFRLLDRKVVDSLNQLPERTRFMKGLFAWVGFKRTAVFYDRLPRHKGTTKWNYWRLWNFALDGILSFSTIPLKVWSYLGLIFAVLAFLYATFLFVRTLVFGIDVPGYASLMVVILFLGGIQLITLGVLGEYLGRVYEEVKGRPLYLVRDAYGFDHNLHSTQKSAMAQHPVIGQESSSTDDHESVS